MYSAKADVSKRFATLQIKKEVFPEGITQFTVFSGTIPVSERLIFIEKPRLTLPYQPIKLPMKSVIRLL